MYRYHISPSKNQKEKACQKIMKIPQNITRTEQKPPQEPSPNKNPKNTSEKNNEKLKKRPNKHPMIFHFLSLHQAPLRRTLRRRRPVRRRFGVAVGSYGDWQLRCLDLLEGMGFGGGVGAWFLFFNGFFDVFWSFWRTLGIQIPSKKIVWGVFSRLNSFSEGSWIPTIGEVLGHVVVFSMVF